MFDILENQRMLEGNVNVTLIPADLRGDMLTQVLTAEQAARSPATTSKGGSPPPIPGASN